MKLTGYKMDCYVKVGKNVYNVLIMDVTTKMEALAKLASCPKYEGGKIIAFEREKFAVDVSLHAMLDVLDEESVARATGSTPEQYDEVL